MVGGTATIIGGDIMHIGITTGVGIGWAGTVGRRFNMLIPSLAPQEFYRVKGIAYLVHKHHV